MKKLILHEVGLRDGLQMEEKLVPLERKIQWLNLLLDAGMDIIQLGSFVHSKYVPQMADTDRLFKHMQTLNLPSKKIVFSGLVLNEKGLERALACGVDLLCMGVSASETHSLKNTRMHSAEAQNRIIAIAKEARAAGKAVQLSVQSAFGCGYEGAIAEEKVLQLVQSYLEAGFTNISLADTAGHAFPDIVKQRFEKVQALNDGIELTCHFHNTYGLALANCVAAQKVGVTTFETAFAGLGGCPFTAVAGGNTCSEDLLHLWHRMGLRRDIRIEPLLELAKKASDYFSRELDGKIYKTGVVPEENSLNMDR